MQDYKCCEITIDKDIASFWVTIAIILATIKLAFVPAISWWWVTLVLLMPLLIAVGVTVLMAIDVVVRWACRQMCAQFQSRVRR